MIKLDGFDSINSYSPSIVEYIIMNNSREGSNFIRRIDKWYGTEHNLRSQTRFGKEKSDKWGNYNSLKNRREKGSKQFLMVLEKKKKKKKRTIMTVEKETTWREYILFYMQISSAMFWCFEKRFEKKCWHKLKLWILS